MLYTLNLFINKIRIAIFNKKKKIYIKYIKFFIKILYLLKKEGFIYNFVIINHIFHLKKKVKIYLKYYNNKSVINKITLMSKLSKKIYVKYNKIPIIINNYGICVLSTSKGIMTGYNAIKNKIGGQCLFYIY
ncbi:MAG: 30S ribosomal protein S8 [Candidatus Shikimatogenerans sp. Ttur]|uniref:Small ribosomal subunit protein uS8 n=1 Tax=Candidatus Shikimatogenerans sp. Ttur TaxID=3158569 RepID=A0AAU7ZXF9_9FLAO